MKKQWWCGTVLTSLILAGCGEKQVECVPASVSEASAQNSQFTINRQLAEGGRDTGAITAVNPQVHIYMDVSNSMRGFLSGATCGECVSPNYDPKSGRYDDPLFSTLVGNLISLPLQSLPTAKTSYHAFAAEVVDITHNDLATITKLDQCYDYNAESVRKIIDDREYRKFRSNINCIFDNIGVPSKSNIKSVGSRDRSPFKKLFEDIERRLTDDKDKIDEGLFIIASDLFFSETQEVIGPNSAVVGPLARLLAKGMHVRLFGFRAPFVGWVTDVPGSEFKIRGQAPFYYLAIGTPTAIEQFSRKMQVASLTTQFRTSALDDSRSPLAGSNRYQAYGIGGRGMSGSTSFSLEVELPSGAGSTRAVLSNEADYNQTVSISGDLAVNGAPTTVTWRRRAGEGRRPAVAPQNYRMDILGWRWNGQTADGPNCPASWELVPTDFLNPSALTVAGSDALSLTLFQGGGLSMQPKVPYVIQMELYGTDKTGPGWVQDWSSDAGTVNDDRAAAKEKGALLRTYNLSLLFRSLSAAAPSNGPSLQQPLGSGVLAVRFD